MTTKEQILALAGKTGICETDYVDMLSAHVENLEAFYHAARKPLEDEIERLKKQLEEANEAAECNFELYQDAGRLLYEESNKTGELMQQLETVLAAAEKFLDSHEECTDFDGFTAQIVSMNDYHQMQEAIDAARKEGE